MELGTAILSAPETMAVTSTTSTVPHPMDPPTDDPLGARCWRREHHHPSYGFIGSKCSYRYETTHETHDAISEKITDPPMPSSAAGAPTDETTHETHDAVSEKITDPPMPSSAAGATGQTTHQEHDAGDENITIPHMLSSAAGATGEMTHEVHDDVNANVSHNLTDPTKTSEAAGASDGTADA